MADGERRVTRGNLDDTTKGRGWRTCDNAKGGGNGDYDEGGTIQSLQWLRQCNNGNTYQSFVYNATTNQRLEQNRQAVVVAAMATATAEGIMATTVAVAAAKTTAATEQQQQQQQWGQQRQRQ
jgi:hypothetical protein